MKELSVEILIKHNKSWGLNEPKVRELAIKALKSFGYDKDTELSIAFVGKKKAKELNQQYRQKDYIPQVLGFPMSKEKDVDGIYRLGDIVICTQKLHYEVKYLNMTLDEVLYAWIQHGVENLLK